MSPLEIYRPGQAPETLEDSKKLPFSRWYKLAGFSSDALATALMRSGGKYVRDGAVKLVSVGQFPEIVRGFQLARCTEANHWADGVDTKAPEFSFEKNGVTYVYTHPSEEAGKSD